MWVLCVGSGTRGVDVWFEAVIFWEKTSGNGYKKRKVWASRFWLKFGISQRMFGRFTRDTRDYLTTRL
jgi:hypothetical protein